MKKISIELIQTFNLHLCEEEMSDNTIEKYIRDVNAFMLWLKGKEVNKTTAVEYKKYLSNNYMPASINSMISSLNAFFDFCSWNDCKVKTLKIQRKIFADKEKELTMPEYERLLNTAKNKKNKKLYYLMQTICSTGIRVSELRYIDVCAVKNGQALINCKGKMRVVILPKGLCKMLRCYIKEQSISTGSIFVSKNGIPLNRSNIWKMLKSLCEDAGVSKDKVFPHNLRHLFARTYYSVQKDIVRLADILGHSNINTTRIYTVESGITHRMNIEKLGLLKC